MFVDSPKAISIDFSAKRQAPSAKRQAPSAKRQACARTLRTIAIHLFPGCSAYCFSPRACWKLISKRRYGIVRSAAHTAEAVLR